MNNGSVSIKSSDSKGESATVDIEGGRLSAKSDDGNFSLNASADNFRIKAEGREGKFENGVTLTESELGVPFYPGSEEVTVATMRAESKDEASCISTRTTNDLPQQVIDFYRSQMSVDQQTSSHDKSGEKTELKGRDRQGNDLSVSATREADSQRTGVVVVRVVKKH